MAGSETPWVDGLTIGDVLARTARAHGGRDAAVFCASGHRRTYAEFDRDVDVAARGLLALGIGKGDHVAVWATNVPEWVVLQFATARIGAVLVTINPAYRPFELKYVLRQSDAVALFLVRHFKSSDYYAMLGRGLPGAGAVGPAKLSSGGVSEAAARGCHSRTSRPPARSTWDAMLDRGRRAYRAADVAEIAATLDPSDPINIQYTSGTTGFPKAATLSHRNLLLNVFYVGECQQLTADDRICIPVPFYHCFGCVLGTLCAAVYGAAMVVPAESFDPTRHARRRSSRSGPPCSTACRRCSSPSLRTPTFAEPRSDIAAHRHHGGQPLPDRSHAAGGRPDGLPRGDDRLRPDRGLADHHANAHRRSARAARRNRRPADSRRRSEDRRSGDRAKRWATTSRASSARAGTCVMLGYYNQPGGDRRGDRRRRLAAHRRPGRAAAERLLPHHRAASRTWSSAAARTFTRARSRSSCSRTRRSSKRPWSACPTASTAKSCAPGSSSRPARR